MPGHGRQNLTKHSLVLAGPQAVDKGCFGPAAWVLAAGILLSLGSLYLLWKRRFAFSGLALLTSLVLMVTTRHQLRLLQLQGQFDPATWRIAPQWSAFALFTAFLAIAVATVFYMLRLFFRPHSQP